jgi:acylphosphatase
LDWDPKRVRAIIKGRVQGVSFRFYALQQARKLGLVGWVRNLDNGDVELVAEGKLQSLQSLLNWCEKGPPTARVERVDPKWETWKGEFSAFSIDG